jgi:hypothetical protein
MGQLIAIASFLGLHELRLLAYSCRLPSPAAQRAITICNGSQEASHYMVPGTALDPLVLLSCLAAHWHCRQGGVGEAFQHGPQPVDCSCPLSQQ